MMEVYLTDTDDLVAAEHVCSMGMVLDKQQEPAIGC